MLALAKAAASSGGGNFLVPNATILVEFVIFVVVLGLMAKFVLPSLQQVMSERDERIRSDQQASDAGGSQAAELERERQRVLEAARQEARSLLAAAGEQAGALTAAARERGQRELERRIGESAAAATTERTRLEGELSGDLERLVAEAAGRVLGEQFDAAAHRDVLISALSEARASASS